MATHDYVIDNATAAAVRADINSVLAAIRTTNSSATPPAQTFGGMLWFDTANNAFKMRNAADSAWVTIGTIGTGFNITPSIIKAASTSGVDFQNSAGTSRMVLNNAGDLQVDGTITAGGDVTAFSDARLKDNVETLDGTKVFQMRGVSYTKGGVPSAGVIAQELAKVAPELVNDSNEYLSVAYGNLAGYLIESVKALKAQVDDQAELIKELQEKQNG